MGHWLDIPLCFVFARVCLSDNPAPKGNMGRTGTRRRRNMPSPPQGSTRRGTAADRGKRDDTVTTLTQTDIDI